MFGKVSKASPSPKVERLNGSQTPSLTAESADEERACCETNAEDPAIREARTASEKLAMVKSFGRWQRANNKQCLAAARSPFNLGVERHGGVRLAHFDSGVYGFSLLDSDGTSHIPFIASVASLLSSQIA